jgi:hypothetical protein
MPFPDLTLVATGRQLTFATQPDERAHIFRRVGGETAPWQRVAVNARSPFVDEDVLALGSAVEYYLHVQGKTAEGAPIDRSHLVGTTL